MKQRHAKQESVVYPLAVYYDASCPLCAEEMHTLKKHDAHGRLLLIDCSEPLFNAAETLPVGLDKNVLMRRIHACDAAGRWLDGIAVFEAAYRAVGIESMARLWGHPFLRPLWNRLYPWVARNRMSLSRMGLTPAFGYGLRMLARRAEQRAQSCGGQSACVSGNSAD